MTAVAPEQIVADDGTVMVGVGLTETVTITGLGDWHPKEFVPVTE